AVGLAASVISVMSPYIEGVNLFGTRLTGVAKENALIMTFLVTFLGSAIVLATVLLKNTSLKSKKHKARKQRPAARPAGAAQQTATSAAQPATPMVPQDAETQQLESMSETDAMGQFREDAADGSYSVDASATSEASEQEDDSIKRGVVLDAEDFPMTGTNGEVGLSPNAEKQKQYIMKFIDKAMTVVGKDKKSMSNFDKFGVSLFMAGACETLGQKQELSEADIAKIMADSVQTMGFKRSHAKTFADKYEEYLVQDPTYMQMFQAGRNSLATYLTDESRIEKNMEASMAEWNKPKVKESAAGPVTVLFTDIAGSTAMTQNLGDAGAQHVVRAHNRVVREALTMWNGKEVKHTGDGIMASFVKTSDSLDAAIQMQRETAEYTAQNADKPLHLKIGINAGEPIAEDNDLFGSTVQMSARIVDKAQADEIFVSEIVRGICAGKNYKFTNRGTYPMKGFDVDPILYEVVWKE
ncbi:MAG: adenylate/guanylate cyclase domain-containing protein, partial [Rhodospirillaceae bacterium]|nr:adenylate/guanylate cyclase domain-containing protein [Rhodospirillaceae bacterium]